MKHLGKAKPIQDLPKSNLWVIYGKSGSGKTHVLSTFPKPMLYLRVGDDGSSTISDDEEGIYAIEVANIQMLKEIALELRDDREYATIAVDTFSMVVNEWTDENAVQKDKKMTLQMWGELKTDQEELVKLFHMLASTRNVVLTCHEATDTIQGYEDELTPDIRPSLSKGARTYLEGMANYGIHTTVIERDRIKNDGTIQTKMSFAAHLASSPYYWVKTQKPAHVRLPKLVINPSYDKIMNLMGGDK